MLTLMLVLATVLLSAANGANDNVKGAATLVGSGVLRDRPALLLATLATGLGGVASVLLANGLLQAFSGKGIVPDALTTALPFLTAVAIAAATTVWVATWLGMPISTTHALIGSLVGAGLAFAPAHVEAGVALKTMALPLISSPLIAFALSITLASMLLRPRKSAHVSGATSSPRTDAQLRKAPGDDLPLPQPGADGAIAIDTSVARSRFRVADLAHLASAVAVSFARGLNDTPKIAALAAAAGLGSMRASGVVVVAMAAGGLLASRRVTETLARKVTPMSHAEGLTANGVTALLVLGASRLGLPVSTTHVSTGALFGLAARHGRAASPVVRQILLSWLFTLPAAGLIAWLGGLLLR